MNTYKVTHTNIFTPCSIQRSTERAESLEQLLSTMSMTGNRVIDVDIDIPVAYAEALIAAWELDAPHDDFGTRVTVTGGEVLELDAQPTGSEEIPF